MAKKRTGPQASERTADTSGDRRSDDAPYDATEPERIRDLERSPRTAPNDEDEFVTDAELEARDAELPSEED